MASDGKMELGGGKDHTQMAREPCTTVGRKGLKSTNEQIATETKDMPWKNICSETCETESKD